MALTPGTRLGAYEIRAAIGAGGMGEVYRARDTKLGRDVAIKTLPQLAAGDPERLARFEREAQLLAALNHPHIAAIYGFEDSSFGRFLVLELVDGESLADRLARDGALPFTEALRVAGQIIEALEAAHDKGIIHRDLKPGNIMLTADGQVKVLDFGLARAAEGAAASSVSNSPTMSLAATQAGVILGTAAYMSPEQAKGRLADKRSDVWAFGCVLYEMLTRRKAFEGEDVSDTLAAILRGEPDWNAIPADVPTHVTAILKRCLERDRKARIPDISVVRYLLTEAPAQTAPAAAVVPAAKTSRRRLIAIGFAGLAGGLALAAVAWLAAARWRSEPAPQSMRFAIAPGAGQSVAFSPVDRTVTISPDGRLIAYVARSSGGDTLMIRRVDQLEPIVIGGTSGFRYPFFSPDSRWVGYMTGNDLRKVSVTGGPPMTICRVAGGIRGAAWTRSNDVIFGTNDPTTGLMIVPAAGGDARELTKPQQGEDHFQPSILPDDRTLLFTIFRAGSTDAGQIAVLDLETRQHRVILRGGTNPEYVRSGHLVYATAGTLRAVRFDAKRREVLGDPVPVEQGVLTLPASGAANYSLSNEGHMVFTPGTDSGARRTLVWVNRDGREEPIKVEPRTYGAARLSPDGTKLAVDVRDNEQDVWILDFDRATPSRLTFDPLFDGFPIWMPDGRRLVFQSARSGLLNVYRQAADGTGTAEQLTRGAANQAPNAISPDGTQLILMEVRAETGPDVLLLRLDGKSQPQSLISGPYNELNAELSPGGRWLAYQSNESGTPQIYVRPFPQIDSGRWQISPAGGTRPAWARSGRELFYLGADGAMMSVSVETTPTFRADRPIQLFSTRYCCMGLPFRSYDVAADGKRFVMVKDPQADQGNSTPGMVFVLNWAEEMKAKVR